MNGGNSFRICPADRSISATLPLLLRLSLPCLLLRCFVLIIDNPGPGESIRSSLRVLDRARADLSYLWAFYGRCDHRLWHSSLSSTNSSDSSVRRRQVHCCGFHAHLCTRRVGRCRYEWVCRSLYSALCGKLISTAVRGSAARVFARARARFGSGRTRWR